MSFGPCPACGGALAAWRQAPSAEPALDAEFALARCQACGTAVTLGDTPTAELHETGSYGAGAPRLASCAAPVLALFDRQRLRILRRAVRPPARLLDVGAGRGRFVAAARAAGYDAEGIEPAPRGALARAERGVELAAHTIETAPVQDGSLDAVTLWHVLEHVDDPGAAVARIAEWVRPGGALLVGVPNVASLQARLGGARWFHLDLPRHRTHFSPAGLEILLRRSGFDLFGTHHVLAEHNPYGMWQSLVNRLTKTPSYLFNLLKRNAPMRSVDLATTILALPLLPAAALLEVAAGLTRRGGTIAILALRRPPGATGPTPIDALSRAS